MPLNYHIVPRAIPGKPDDPNKYYASVVRQQELDLTTLAKELAKQSTLSPVDIKACLESFIEQMPFFLKRGSIIRLGDFGSFFLNISSEGADTEEQFEQGMIKDVAIRFRAGKRLKNEMLDVEYAKID